MSKVGLHCGVVKLFAKAERSLSDPSAVEPKDLITLSHPPGNRADFL